MTGRRIILKTEQKPRPEAPIEAQRRTPGEHFPLTAQPTPHPRGRRPVPERGLSIETEDLGTYAVVEAMDQANFESSIDQEVDLEALAGAAETAEELDDD